MRKFVTAVLFGVAVFALCVTSPTRPRAVAASPTETDYFYVFSVTPNKGTKTLVDVDVGFSLTDSTFTYGYCQIYVKCWAQNPPASMKTAGADKVVIDLGKEALDPDFGGRTAREEVFSLIGTWYEGGVPVQITWCCWPTAYWSVGTNPPQYTDAIVDWDTPTNDFFYVE